MKNLSLFSFLLSSFLFSSFFSFFVFLRISPTNNIVIIRKENMGKCHIYMEDPIFNIFYDKEYCSLCGYNKFPVGNAFYTSSDLCYFIWITLLSVRYQGARKSCQKECASWKLPKWRSWWGNRICLMNTESSSAQ